MAREDGYSELKRQRMTPAAFLQMRQYERETSTTGHWSGFIMPLPRGTYRVGNRGYGVHNHPRGGHAQMHNGHDMQAPEGTPILAPQDGTISDVLPYHGSAGNFLKMKGQTHGFGFMHLSRFAPGIREGTRVKQGQIIGFVGSTGESSGPHLHYEVYSLANGKPMDPKPVAMSGSRTITTADARSITQGHITTAALFAPTPATPAATAPVPAPTAALRIHTQT